MTFTRRAASTLAAATLITLAAGGCGGSAGSGPGAQAPPAEPPVGINNVCKAATTNPTPGYPGRGVVGGYVDVTCSQTPDIFDLDVYLEWTVDPSDAHDAPEIVDHCYQYDIADIGAKCVVASACKPGYWEITWKLAVDIDGAPASSSDSTSYHATITKGQCAAAAA